MAAFLHAADRVLRGDRRATGTGLATLVGFVAVFGLAYGAVMGSFGGWGADRPLQVVYSALKVPLLLLGTFVLALPSFFVLNTLAGLRDDFPEALRALAATQAGLAIALAALAPLTALWYLSSGDYNQAILFNGVMFAVASGAGQLLLRVHYRPLLARDRRHRWLLTAWLVVYAFIGIQMGWMLRPFVGDPRVPVEFIRADTFGNAYLIVAGKVRSVLGW